MPHETDASALIWLVWMVWIYWGIRSWLKQPSSGEDTDDPGRTGAPAKMARLTTTAPGFSAAGEKAARPAAPSHLATFVAQIRQVDPHFDLHDFLDSAAAAYEAVTIAFATGDRHMLKLLLAHEIYDSFDAAIAEREARGDTMEVIFSRIDKPEISGSSLADGMATLSVRFTGELFRTTRSMQGEVIDGSPTAQTRVCDAWVFVRPQGSRDPVWRVAATNAAPPVITAAKECCT